MAATTDSLLLALSKGRCFTKQQFKRCIAIIADSLNGDVTHDPDDPRHHSTLLHALTANGHLVVDYASCPYRVYIAPRVLVRLPTSSPQAVLVGHRVFDTVYRLRNACDSARATLSECFSDNPSFLIPSRLLVEGNSDDILAAIARQVDAVYYSSPPAWRLLHFSDDVNAYYNALQWRAMQVQHGVDTRFFDTSTQRFVKEAPASGYEALVESYDPHRHRRTYTFRRNHTTPEMAIAERNMARYVALSRSQTRVLRYEHSGGLLVPVGLPLPSLFHTAMGLCSCKPPTIAIAQHNHSSGVALSYWKYHNVPLSLALLMGTKLSQVLNVEPFPSEHTH